MKAQYFLITQPFEQISQIYVLLYTELTCKSELNL